MSSTEGFSPDHLSDRQVGCSLIENPFPEKEENIYESMTDEELEREMARFRRQDEEEKYKFKSDDELEEMWAKEFDRLRQTYKRNPYAQFGAQE